MPITVLLHGFFAGPALWRPLIQRLHARGYGAQTHALALPFHGGPTSDTFEGCCQVMWQNIEQREFMADGPIHLVGYSLGARMALSMACRQPDDVAAVTLIGVHPGLRDKAARAERRRSDERWQYGLRSQTLQAFALAWDEQPLFTPRQSLGAEAQEALADCRLSLRAEELAQSLVVLGLGNMPDTSQALPGLKLPVHLVTGQHDGKFSALAKDMQGLLPHAAHSVIEGARHDVVLSHVDELAQALVAAPGELSLH